MWSTLFKIHAHAYKVLNHIIPSVNSTGSSLKDIDPNLWYHLDAIVLQWIYGTIFNDLLNTILEYHNFHDMESFAQQFFVRTHMPSIWNKNS